MANTGFKGIDIRQTGNQLVFRASLKDGATGAVVTTGTTSLYLYELQSDGTLKSYDFNDNTFKTSALSTATASMTHRQGNNSTVNTGIWTYSHSSLSGFTIGSVYIAVVTSSVALPPQQEREFIYGSAEGDLVVTANGTGVGEMNVDLQLIKGQSVTCSGGVTIPAATLASTTNISNIPSVAQIATAVWQDSTSGDFTVSGSIGKVMLGGQSLSSNSIAVTLGVNAISFATFAAGAIDANAIASNAITSAKIQDAAITSAKFAANALDAVWSTTSRTLTSITLPTIPTGWITANGIASDALNAIGDAAEAHVWESYASAYTDPLSLGNIVGALASSVSSSLSILSSVSYGNESIKSVIDTINGNVDVEVSTRLATLDYVAPDNSDLLSIKSTIDANLDATVSSRLSASDYTEPDNLDVTAIRTLLEHPTYGNQALLNQMIATPSGVWVYIDRTLTSSSSSSPTVEEIETYLATLHGSGQWDAAGSQSTLSASGVWSYSDRRLTSGSGIGFPTAQDIDAQLSITHGSGSWRGDLHGTYVYDVYTKDQSNVAIGSVCVEVRSSGTNELLQVLRSNATTGKASFNLDSGSYALYAYKSSVATFVNPFYVNVSSDGSKTLNGTKMTVPVPANADSSSVYAYSMDLDLGVQEGVEMYITPSGTPTTFAERAVLMKPISALSDATGFVSIDVAINTPVRVRIPKAQLDKYIISPASGSLNIATA